MFSEAINFFKNLHFRCCKQTVISGKLKNSWQSSIMHWDVVWKTLNRDLLTVKSRECSSVLLIGQASRPYSKQGIHFDLIRVKITSSDANLPNLPYIALNARKNDCLAWCKEHLKIRDRTIKIPRYRRESTHWRVLPSDVVMLAHGALKRGPILVQIDFLVLIAKSSDCKFKSHKLISRCNAETDGANNKISSA